MPNYSTAPAVVNPDVQLDETLAGLDHAYRKFAGELAGLIERLHAAAVPYIAADLERRHQANPLEPLRAALAQAPARKSLMPMHESPERECDTCGETALCDHDDPFETDNPNVICGACEATQRARPYAPLAEEEVA